MTQQPKAVWVVAFACVVAFMGIGLVDPILPALASQLDVSPSQVELLFTSYLPHQGQGARLQPVRRAMERGPGRRLDGSMVKNPPMPPHHRPYPRSRPTPGRAGAAPRPAASPTVVTAWSRPVPDGRRFPRSSAPPHLSPSRRWRAPSITATRPG